jgi:hypothetical protein
MMAPSGVHGAIAAQPPPSAPSWPIRLKATSTRNTARAAALTVAADLMRPTSACPMARNTAMPSAENARTSPYWATDSASESIRAPMTAITSATARPAIACAVMRLAMMAQPGAGVTRSRVSTPASLSRPIMSA